MADHQEYDLHTLQEEAIRRAREMQARAQIPPRGPAFSGSRQQRRPAGQPVQAAARQEDPPAAESRPARDDPPPVSRGPRPAEEPRDPKPSAPPPNPTANLFDAITKDGDRSLILVLILILMEDKADMSLLFALMYLLL